MYDLYLLDYNFKKTQLVEDYDSLVWTERYSTSGEFELDVKDYYLLSQRLSQYKYLSFSESRQIMQIESANVSTESPDGRIVKLTGNSLETFLNQRNTAEGSTQAAGVAEIITSSPAGIIDYLVNEYCVNTSTAGAVNVIPGLSILPANVYPPASTAAVSLSLTRGPLYDLIASIAAQYGLGFVIGADANPLGFQVYTGIDRTDKTNPQLYMEYSADANNFSPTSYLESIQNFKNHARVLGAKTGTDVYAPGVDATVSGFDRRTIVVQNSEIGADTDNPTTIAEDRAQLAQLGYQTLADINNRYTHMTDGEIDQKNWNKVSYGLGDLVMVKDLLGNRTKCQITESVWSVDGTGRKLTPTFTAI